MAIKMKQIKLTTLFLKLHEEKIFHWLSDNFIYNIVNINLNYFFVINFFLFTHKYDLLMNYIMNNGSFKKYFLCSFTNPELLKIRFGPDAAEFSRLYCICKSIDHTQGYTK